MFSNTTFWVFIFICLVGYFIFRFGMVGRGQRKTEIEFIGGVTIFISFILTLLLVGWKALIVQLGIFWVVITPIVEITISSIQKRLYGIREKELGSKPLSEKGKESLYDHLIETGQISDKS